MDRESFIFYRSFYEAIKCMPQDVQAEIYPAICEYALFGTKMARKVRNMASVVVGQRKRLPQPMVYTVLPMSRKLSR